MNFHLQFIIDQRSQNIVLTVGRCLSQVSESCGMLRRCHCEENLRPGPGSQPCAVRYRQLALPHGSVLSLKHKILNTKFSGGPRSQSKPFSSALSDCRDLLLHSDSLYHHETDKCHTVWPTKEANTPGLSQKIYCCFEK